MSARWLILPAQGRLHFSTVAMGVVELRCELAHERVAQWCEGASVPDTEMAEQVKPGGADAQGSLSGRCVPG